MLYDRDIREPLFDFLELTYGKVRILEEKRMGRSRADIMMVRPGTLSGIEIKSDADTYTRLHRQVQDYDRYFDSNYIVVGVSHAYHIEEHVPEYWGVITVEVVEDRADFYILREAKPNEKMKPERLMQFLWRPELAHMQELDGLPKYRDKSKDFVIGKLLERVPWETLKGQISEELFERDYTTIDETIRTYKKGRNKKGHPKSNLGHP